MLRLAARQPANGTLAGLLYIVVGRGVFHALIKGHGDIRTQIGLDAHTLFRPHEDSPSVDMRGKGHALLLDFPEPGQGEDLKTAAVGEHRSVPLHEAVQTAHLPHQFISGPEMEVVGIRQLDLTAQFLQVVGRDRTLDGALGSHVHKHRRLDNAVGRCQNAPAGVTFRF